jgi:HAE1 family hydrophobic/amphiphilic exporter-1
VVRIRSVSARAGGSSSGAGAIGRQILGTAVVGGTIAASVIGVFLIPVTYTVFAGGLRRARAKATEVIAPDAASAPQS